MRQGGISSNRRAQLRRIAEAGEPVDPALLLEALDGYEGLLEQWRNQIPDAIDAGCLDELLEDYRAFARLRKRLAMD